HDGAYDGANWHGSFSAVLNRLPAPPFRWPGCGAGWIIFRPHPKADDRQSFGDLSAVTGGKPMSQTLVDRAGPAKTKLGVVDCDVHHALRSSKDLMPCFL